MSQFSVTPKIPKSPKIAVFLRSTSANMLSLFFRSMDRDFPASSLLRSWWTLAVHFPTSHTTNTEFAIYFKPLSARFTTYLTRGTTTSILTMCSCITMEKYIVHVKHWNKINIAFKLSNMTCFISKSSSETNRFEQIALFVSFRGNCASGDIFFRKHRCLSQSVSVCIHALYCILIISMKLL